MVSSPVDFSLLQIKRTSQRIRKESDYHTAFDNVIVTTGESTGPEE